IRVVLVHPVADISLASRRRSREAVGVCGVAGIDIGTGDDASRYVSPGTIHPHNLNLDRILITAAGEGSCLAVIFLVPVYAEILTSPPRRPSGAGSAVVANSANAADITSRRRHKCKRAARQVPRSVRLELIIWNKVSRV